MKRKYFFLDDKNSFIETFSDEKYSNKNRINNTLKIKILVF